MTHSYRASRCVQAQGARDGAAPRRPTLRCVGARAVQDHPWRGGAAVARGCLQRESNSQSPGRLTLRVAAGRVPPKLYWHLHGNYSLCEVDASWTSLLEPDAAGFHGLTSLAPVKARCCPRACPPEAQAARGAKPTPCRTFAGVLRRVVVHGGWLHVAGRARATLSRACSIRARSTMAAQRGSDVVMHALLSGLRRRAAAVAGRLLRAGGERRRGDARA